MQICSNVRPRQMQCVHFSNCYPTAIPCAPINSRYYGHGICNLPNFCCDVNILDCPPCVNSRLIQRIRRNIELQLMPSSNERRQTFEKVTSIEKKTEPELVFDETKQSGSLQSSSPKNVLSSNIIKTLKSKSSSLLQQLLHRKSKTKSNHSPSPTSSAHSIKLSTDGDQTIESSNLFLPIQDTPILSESNKNDLKSINVKSRKKVS